MKKPNFSWKRVADSFSTRSFRAGGYSVAAAAIVLAIAVMVNVFAAALPASVTKFDTTANQLFTLSEQTEKLVGGLTDEVTVYWIVRSGREESYLESLLSRYQSLSDKIRVVKKDPDVFPTFTQQYTDSFTENSLIVEAGERYRYVDYNDIFVMDYASYYYYGTENWSFCGESELTSAIDYVVSENLPKVYLLTGHGESSLSDSFASAVKQQNIETAELSLLTLESVPADADCILINAPQSDISLDEQSKLQEYLGNGGNLFLITDPPKNGALTNLEALMADYGVTTVDGIVVVASPQELVSMIVAKAVNMAEMMKVPMLGIVENMSYIVCPDCGKHINVFGESHVDEVAAKHGLPVLAKCPIDPQLAALSDAGMIETYGGEYLEGAADACEKLLKK